jgi:MFS family permease
MQMAFNVNALPVSIGPISEDLNTSATAVGTALVIYSLFVAAFVMLGAKLGKLFGARLVFQVTVVAHGLAMGMMAFSTDSGTMNSAQAVAGLAAAALVPTLVVLIAANYGWCAGFFCGWFPGYRVKLALLVWPARFFSGRRPHPQLPIETYPPPARRED